MSLFHVRGTVLYQYILDVWMRNLPFPLADLYLEYCPSQGLAD